MQIEVSKVYFFQIFKLIEIQEKDDSKSEMINIKKIIFKEEEILDKPSILQDQNYAANDNHYNENNINNFYLGRKLISPIFYVSKFHKRKCSHSSSKTKKNLIKKLVQEDYFRFKRNLENKKNLNNLNQKQNQKQNIKTNKISKIKNKPELNLNDEINPLCLSEISKDDNKLFLKKKTTNRNFRLFDKDVVIKKIMSNFLKFLKLILESFTIDNKSSSIYEIKRKTFQENFSNELKCKTLLNNKKMKDFLLIKNKKSCNKKRSLNRKNNINKDCDCAAFLEAKLIDVYKNVFLSSSFLLKYTFPKIKKDHDQSYYLHFNKFLLKILE